MLPMRAPNSHDRRSVHRLASLALVLWLGGAGCLVGCEMDATAAPSGESSPPVSEASCPAFTGSGGDCCHKAAAKNVGTHADIPSRPGRLMSCCPLAGQSAAVAGKPRHSDKAGTVLPVSILLAIPRPEAHALEGVGGLRVPDRGSTYLRCCTFLI